MSHYLDELNPAQRAAAMASDGPVMIIAGAGSGKTRVLTYRIAYLLEKGVDPFNILALTFTNKAAREMKNRIAKIVGQSEAKNLWMGTFHSIFAKMLRIESSKIGYPANFTIYDTDDCKSVIKAILKQMNLDEKIYKPSLVLHRISDAKNKLISAHQYANNPITQAEDVSSRKPFLGKVFIEYQKRNFKSAAMDFDDLLYQTNILLRDFPDVLLKYQNKFRYILLDEYQDTNFSQYVIIKQLAARFQNICVVGDDAQSIYAFRGANIQNILNFEKDYPDLKTFKLEQNYRSTKTIVEAANKIISNNKDQFEKKVFTENEEGTKILVVKAQTDNEEGQKIARLIASTKTENKANNKDFAILYRTNAQSRSFEESLRRLNIAYRIYGGTSFYQRKEIKDVLAYYNLALNNKNDESLRRIINYPARGIGNSTLDKVSVAASENNLSMFEVLTQIRDFNLGINAGILAKIGDFVAQIKSYSLAIPVKDAFEIANHIAVNSGIIRELYADKTPEGTSRYENVQELLNGIKDFTQQERTPQDEEVKKETDLEFPEKEETMLFNDKKVESNIRTLNEFMQEISLLTDADKNADDDSNTDRVSLMTVHAAKGLEFKFVYIVGLEENLFPSQLSINNRVDLEEERRLFYVALTRAEKQATISYAGTRYRFGNLIYCEPSRFIEEIDGAFLEYEEIETPHSFNNDLFESFRKNYQKNDLNDLSKNENLNHNKIKFISGPKKNLKKISSQSAIKADSSSNKLLQVNDLVQHEKFGTGTIKSLEGVWPETKAIIQFDQTGIKSLLLKFAKLAKVNN
ncbi:MAG: UvrD-helicase domain-containing protein [Sphingobacteriaceae bacterium]|nr:UvrD-helicase domain-containing protein [Sphingobacteriaceae bacterium]